MNLEHLRISKPPLIIGAMAGYAYDPMLEAAMVVQSRYDGPVPLSRKDEANGLLWVPRMLPMTYKGAEDHRVSPKEKFELECKFPPRNSEQARVIKESYALLSRGHSHIIQGNTGFGKTYIGVRLAVMLGLKVLVVVTKEDLMSERQWRGAFKKFAGIEDSDIGIIQQKKCQVEGKKVCFGMVHSLAKDKYDESIYNDFGLIIFDEVHHMAAETFSVVCGMFNATLRLGLSATPKRIDGKEFIFYSHIGPVAVASELTQIPPKVLVAKSRWKVPIVNWRINGAWQRVRLPHEAGKLGAVLTSLSKDPERNALITKFTLQAYQKDRRIVVISALARDKHLNHLAALAIKAGIPETDIGFYVGGMKEEALDAAVGKRVVYATYQMCGEATDVPWWDTLIMATPMANITQAVGRILREYPDKKEPVVVDIVDEDSHILSGYYEARLKRYSVMGGSIVRVH